MRDHGNARDRYQVKEKLWPRRMALGKLRHVFIVAAEGRGVIRTCEHVSKKWGALR